MRLRSLFLEVCTLQEDRDSCRGKPFYLKNCNWFVVNHCCFSFSGKYCCTLDSFPKSPKHQSCKLVRFSSAKPMLTRGKMSAGTWIEKARLPCWPLYSQQVSHQRWISGIHCMQATKHASEGSTLSLKPRGDVTRSPKQGYQWFHEKDLCPPNFF